LPGVYIYFFEKDRGTDKTKGNHMQSRRKINGEREELKIDK
jgi:hypothetical protein